MTFSGNAPGSGRLSAIFLVINACLGAGLLNFPQAFDQGGGIVVSIIVQAVRFLLILLTDCLIVFHNGLTVALVLTCCRY